MALPEGYVSASVLPAKLLQCQDAVQNGKIVPYHLQLVPTNACNGHCPWCCCAKVNRSETMPYAEVCEVLHHFWGLGSRAVTLTGGGDPTCHPRLFDIVAEAKSIGYDVAMITNGLLLAKGEEFLPINGKLTWMRLSLNDTESGNYPMDRIRRICRNLPDVEIGLSFAVTKNVSFKTAAEVAALANEIPNLTHVRYTEDIVAYAPEQIELVRGVCQNITDKGIYQPRHNGERGPRECWVSRLKPLVDPRGFMFPCCGVQYAQDGHEAQEFSDDFKMCHWRDFHKGVVFNGSICDKCYFNDYNRVLALRLAKLAHPKFL
jgi:organic radical activating enzyme